MRKAVKHAIGLCLALALMLSLLPIIPASAAETVRPTFTPNPQTDYARAFITKCEGQQWFINEIEYLLNMEQKTLDTITDNSVFTNIKSLGFADKKISGKIPAAIGELKELRYLFLSGNSLTGAVPAELYSLPKLENIDLTGNGYSGAIPMEFGNMQSLKILMLSKNAYTGSIPSSILSNKKITVLDVSSNKLSGALPSGLNNMTALTYLAVSDNTWTQGAIPDFSALRDLITLSAWSCNLTGTIPATVYTLTKLQVLDLVGNSLTGGISNDIGNLTNLQTLGLGKNQLTGEIPVAFGNLVNLKNADLADNELSGTIPDIFGNMTKLTLAHMENNKLRGHVPATLKARYDSGARIILDNNYLTGPNLKGMADNTNNFTDGASTPQYQLAAFSPVRISETDTTILYSLLKNVLRTTGSTSGKPLLPADCYVVVSVHNDPSGKIIVTTDANGIYVQATGEVKLSDNIRIEIRIKDNDGSDYSTTLITLTTETVSGGSVVGGSSGSPVIIIEDAEIPQALDGHIAYITGYPDATFRPENSISREEVATMLIRALELETGNNSGSTPFSDVSPERWSAAYITKAFTEGIITGYPDGSFAPEKAMTRAELAACLVRIMRSGGATATGASLSFPDVTNEWYAQYVKDAASLGLVSGYPDGTFRPDKTVTRAEAVTMINRMLGRDPLTAPALQTEVCPFSDVTRSHWAYLHVLEASISRQYF